MAETEQPQEAATKKGSKKPLIIGLVLGLLMAGGGFYASWSGLILGSGDGHAADEAAPNPLPDISFVPVDSVIVSIGPGEDGRHLRFTSQLEVAGPRTAEVTSLLPRIVDVMNSYLRALDANEFDDPAALVRMRAQLLRRIQIVTGENRVRDLLVTEFVLN
ncbi:flagellar basal body protein FliL [Cypionkella aquatica]|uniref:Flagellar protein FliL n=1 Tax=Cypionkella aquatica TaxID=1756042 RepID=A0AA37WYG4_9RHOB|nr:flagellar basal body-associated FliL family protein [Cypionkella aquatica]GLS85202.1 flagellar basal body protein FliL [Cypionkella aquatica]